eukprot:TRINITY_DN75399_c0_g1_i1.p1 TRINITY_DN75399_c0_g1~~TRINITY_DN75399_c0_g1_i1.p1  ORF type:complete len:441 (+),score=64.87 TRINITY_DN75399_c0_g1_i1:120-1442(+)
MFAETNMPHLGTHHSGLLSSQACSVFLLSAFSLSFVQAQLPASFEIEFEPMNGGGPFGRGGPFESFEINGGSRGVTRPNHGGLVSRDAAEARVDLMLNSMLGDLMGPPRQDQKGGFMHRGMDPFVKPFGERSQIILDGGNDGPITVMELSGPASESPRQAMSGDIFRDLFPGPLQGSMSSGHVLPFDQPDPFIQEMTKGLDKAFLGLMGNLHKAVSMDRSPNSCERDIKAHCKESISKLHCLGQHPEDISDACRKDVGKSVPFRCSRWIGKFCDVMEVGVLKCLGDHLAEVDDTCRDAVLATHHVISKANTHKTAVVDTSTGAKQVSTPSLAVPPPPPVGGVTGSTSSVVELPPSVLSLLGSSKSMMESAATRASQSAGRSHLWIAVVFAAIVASVFVFAPKSWPVRRIEKLLPKGREGQQLLESNLEMPKAMDMPILRS